MLPLINPLILLWFKSQYTPTEIEIEFVRKLNLKFPNQLPHDEKINLGRIEANNDGWVEISVTCLPVRIYEFVVHNSTKNKTFQIRAVGGDIRNYWKLVEAILLNRTHHLKPEWVKNCYIKE